MVKFAGKFVIAASFAAIFLIGSVSNSAHAAKCGPLPKVDWWGKSHSKVIKTVNKKYKGNWDSYISRWNKYRTRMERLHEAGSAAVVKSRGLRLEGKQLEEHIEDIDQRIEVLSCLKDQEETKEAASLENFSTAAGGNKSSRNNRNVETASVSSGDLDVEINASCKSKTVVFKITNLGDKWPRLGTVNIYRVDGKALLSKRRLKLANSQQAMFKIKDRGRENGLVGLWLEPSWTDRKFKYDATISCS